MRIGLWMLILKRAMVLQVIFQWMWQQQLLMREGVHAMVEEEGEVARKRLGEGAKEERQVDVERCRSVSETGDALRQHTADCTNPTGSCRKAAPMPEALRQSLIGCSPDHLSSLCMAIPDGGQISLQDCRRVRWLVSASARQLCAGCASPIGPCRGAQYEFDSPRQLTTGCLHPCQVEMERCKTVSETGHALRQHTADCTNPTGSCRRAPSMPEALRQSLIGCIPDHLSFYNSPLRSELG